MTGKKAETHPYEPGRIGPGFEAFLEEQGTAEATTAVAIKRVIAFQLEQAMADQHLSKTEMAHRLNTSRSQLDRLLDPDHEGVSLEALTRAAHAVGRTLRLELV
jgi:antitoxin HicB